ncbi:hypothetical protein CEXT_186921 [Caerostris extrusa]|uniref:Uncharacterized protein n=1 Tax=Caerostris extrusa TaxID=172846 RepID=A0AAV4X6H4_CAEEX|nr:hypothetical protein CEXT_186921 [Caerostris extrusa]
MEGQEGGRILRRKTAALLRPMCRLQTGPDTHVVNAANTMPHRPTCRDISRHIAVPILSRLRNATHVAKCTLACQHWPCISSHIISTISVRYAAKAFPGLGYCRPHALAHWRKAFWVCTLWESLRR